MYYLHIPHRAFPYVSDEPNDDVHATLTGETWADLLAEAHRYEKAKRHQWLQVRALMNHATPTAGWMNRA